jgi:hypothetical protein
MEHKHETRGNHEGKVRIVVRPCPSDPAAVVLDLGGGSEFLLGFGSDELDRVLQALGSRLPPEQRDGDKWVKLYPTG